MFISRVSMSVLVSDWITSRKDFWRRTDFINFLLLWSLFLLLFLSKSRVFWPPGKPVSDLSYLFEKMDNFC